MRFFIAILVFLSAQVFADDIQFPKTKYVVQDDGGKDREIKANLIFTSDSIIVKARKKPSEFAEIPYGSVESVVYERSTHAQNQNGDSHFSAGAVIERKEALANHHLLQR